jgi:hypothetical protein
MIAEAVAVGDLLATAGGRLVRFSLGGRLHLKILTSRFLGFTESPGIFSGSL